MYPLGWAFAVTSGPSFSLSPTTQPLTQNKPISSATSSGQEVTICPPSFVQDDTITIELAPSASVTDKHAERL
ncbi:hypothetical protein BLNAU_24764 [Blattamonas nauphoetae]|nr:hypothetical protein BLNAU_24764 [Blattamonas nauphoetae]